MPYPQNLGKIPTHMQPDAVVAGCIEIFENVWNDCDQIIKALEEKCNNPHNTINWTRATTVGHGVYQDQRTNCDLGISYFANTLNDPLMVDLHNRCNDTLISAATSYCNRHGINENFWQEGYNVIRYQSGQEYKAHYDGATGQGRHISCLIYLNDDYEGGEIEFVDFNIKLKPQRGMLVLFPSNFAYRHIAHPVKSGTKYAIVTWLHDREL